MPEPTSAPQPPEPSDPTPPDACGNCGTKVSADGAFCSSCGKGVTRPAGPPGPAAAPATSATAAAAAVAAPGLIGGLLRRALGTTASGTHRKLTDMDADELGALAKVIEAKRSPLDRWITRGLIPVMLLIAGPLVTYYFTTRADQAAEVMQATNDEIARLSGATDRLETLITDAGARVEQMDDARAHELQALRVIVQRLENALRLVVLQTAIREAAAVQLAAAVKERPMMFSGSDFKPSMTALLRDKRDKIVRQVQEQSQQQFPGIDEDDSLAEVETAFDRYVQQQVQAQQE